MLKLCWSLPLLVAACQTPHAHGPAALEAPAPPSRAELEALPMFDGHTGAAVTMDDLLAAIDAADIVVFGELHGHRVGLPFHQALFETSAERHPTAALSLEFLSRDTQHLLDEYLTDLRTFEEFETACKAIRGSSPTDHAPLINIAKAHDLPVFAANAPRLYTTLVRKQNYAALDALTGYQHTLFSAPPVVPAGGYRTRFFETMAPMFAPGGIHDADASNEAETSTKGVLDIGEERKAESSSEVPFEDTLDETTRASVEGMFRAQTLWDGTMSATVVNAWQVGHTPSFLVIGSFHVNHEGGTLQLIRERAPDARVVLISFEDRTSDALLDEDIGCADFVVYAGAFDAGE
jgi:uncharacterized iron-regulated protein